MDTGSPIICLPSVTELKRRLAELVRENLLLHQEEAHLERQLSARGTARPQRRAKSTTQPYAPVSEPPRD